VKTPSFCKILDLNKTHSKKIFDQNFNLIMAIKSQAWHSEENSTILCSRIVCISPEKISKTYVRKANELCE
jgi:hypothetical protein